MLKKNIINFKTIRNKLTASGNKVSKPFNFFYLQLFFLNSCSFYKIDSYKSTNMNKYIKTTKFLRKPVVTTPLNSIAFNGS